MEKIRLLVVTCGLIACWANEVFAKRAMDFELRADYLSKYIWRGQNLDDDNVLQTGLSASYGGLTVGIWGSLELTNINDNNNEFTEVDYSLEHSGDVPGLGSVGYSVGLIYYDFPNTMIADTMEAYWGLNFDLSLSPYITCYHDLDEAEGTYISFGVGHSVEKIMELGPYIPVGMEIGASFGWGSGSYDKYYWGIAQSKMNDLILSVSFPIEVEGWTLMMNVNYVTLLSDEIRDTDAYGTDSDFFFTGIGVLKRF